MKISLKNIERQLFILSATRCVFWFDNKTIKQHGKEITEQLYAHINKWA